MKTGDETGVRNYTWQIGGVFACTMDGRGNRRYQRIKKGYSSAHGILYVCMVNQLNNSLVLNDIQMAIHGFSL